MIATEEMIQEKLIQLKQELSNKFNEYSYPSSKNGRLSDLEIFRDFLLLKLADIQVCFEVLAKKTEHINIGWDVGSFYGDKTVEIVIHKSSNGTIQVISSKEIENETK